MAIKDMIGPSFVGATTIKWIVTRGLTAAAVTVPDVPGIEYRLKDRRSHYHADDKRPHYTSKEP